MRTTDSGRGRTCHAFDPRRTRERVHRKEFFTVLERIRARARELAPEIASWRHHFHAHPELSFEETETTRKVVELLHSFGYEDLRIGTAGLPTGVVADLNPDRPGRCHALRADIDALPMTEEGTCPYRSTNPKAMHACGHDAHVAMLLGAARILKEMEEDLPGRIRLLFQPSEESPHRSGARAMIAEQALAGVDTISGLHVWSPLASGTLGYRTGPLMASADQWECTIEGKGGHGALPHQAVDPVVTASLLVNALQTIVSRELNPLDTAVLTVGKIEAGTTFNIIPDRAEMMGTVRTLDQGVRKDIQVRMRRIVEGLCETMRCKADFRYKEVLPPTVNDPGLAAKAATLAKTLFGEDNVLEIPPVMASEDMSLFLEKIPGVFLFLGTGNTAKGLAQAHHHPRFDVDDDVLPLGVSLHCLLAWASLAGAL